MLLGLTATDKYHWKKVPETKTIRIFLLNISVTFQLKVIISNNNIKYRVI